MWVFGGYRLTTYSKYYQLAMSNMQWECPIALKVFRKNQGGRTAEKIAARSQRNCRKVRKGGKKIKTWGWA